MVYFNTKDESFGINSAAENFQNTISQILQNIEGVIIISDILIFGISQQEHNLAINKTKCVFNVPQINFFGFFFSQDGIYPDLIKVNSIVTLKSPENATELRNFLGMNNYVGKLLPNLAEKSSNLREHYLELDN